MKYLATLLLVLAQTHLIAMSTPPSTRESASYSLLVDNTLSPVTGAENILTAHRLYQKLDYLSFGFLYDENDHEWGDTGLGLGMRFVKGALFDLPTSHLAMVFQHEVFGHGARLREFDVDGIAYEFDNPPPYGVGGAATSFSPSDYFKLHRQERMMVTTGGMEATGILARQQAFKFLEKGTMNAQEAILYYWAYHDQTDYITGTSSPLDALFGHDVESYLLNLRLHYGSEVVKRNSLKTRARFNYADSYTLLSVYHYFKYLWYGEEEMDIPMLSLGTHRFLPGFRLGLTPFGTEYNFNAYLNYNGKPAIAYIRYGNDTAKAYFGFGIEAKKALEWDNKSYMDVKFDLWKQPKLLISNPNTANSKFGALLNLTQNYEVTRDIAAFVQLGYKTEGYVPGEALRDVLTLRGGITLLNF